MGCPASSAVAGQAGQQQLQVNDRAVTRRREIDHLVQGGSILAAGDNENPGLDLARVAGLVEEGPDVASLVCVVEVSADVHPVHIGVPVAIAENPTNPPLTCGDVVLSGLGQRVLRRSAGSASAVTWAEVCSPSWTYRPRLPRCRCRDLAWSSGAVRPSAARCWRAEWRSWWSVQPCLCGSRAAVACLNRYSARG